MKRLFAFLLAIVLVLGSFPVTSVHVHATEAEEPAVEETTLPAETEQEEETEPVSEETEPVPEETEPATETVPQETEPVAEETEPSDELAMDAAETAEESMLAGAVPEGLEYYIIEDRMSITRYTGTATELVIPSQIEGMPVEAIEGSAFANCTDLTSITIPDTVTYIGYYAFEGCSGLTSLEIPGSVTEISPYAFGGCTGLTSLVIPDSVTKMGACLFAGCTGLESLTIPFVGETKVSAADGYQYPLGSMFGMFDNVLEGYIDVSQTAYIGKDLYSPTTTTYQIPASLRSVTVTGGEVLRGAFQNCSMLTTLNLPATATQIPEDALAGCSGLTAITIPDSVTSIAEKAFSGCYSLASIDIPAGVTTLKVNTFYNCSGLTSLVIPATVTTVEKGALYGCSGLQSLTVSFDAQSGYTKYPLGYFFGTSSYTGGTATKQYYSTGSYSYNTYYIPDTLTSVTVTGSVLPFGAFQNCRNLKQITLPETVTSIETSAFNGCSGLTDIVIPASVTSIKTSAFNGCSGLTSLVIPATVTSVTEGALAGCSGLQSLTVSLDAQTGSTKYPLGYFFGTSSYTGGTSTRQYYSSSGFKNYYIPSKLTSVTVTGSTLPYGAFYNCKSLTEVALSDAVTAISDSAFYYCSGLTAVTIPETVTSIGHSAFYGCTKLASVTIPDTVTTISQYAFKECSAMTELHLGKGVTSVGLDAFHNCTKLTDLYLKDMDAYLKINFTSSIMGVNSLTKNLYLNGSLVTDVVVPEGVTTIPNYVFYHCGSVRSVKFTDEVTGIGRYAFAGCDNLTYLMLGSGLTSVEQYAFYESSGLWHIYTTATEEQFSDVYVSSYNNPFKNAKLHYESDGSALSKEEKTTCTLKALYTCGTCGDSFYDPEFTGTHSFAEGICTVCGAVEGLEYTITGTGATITGYTGSAATLNIPSSVEGVAVTAIGNYAFQENKVLTAVTIPDTVTTIGNSAFDQCSALTAVVLPKDLTAIADYTFSDCTSLTSITIPNKVTSIGTWAFFNCTGLTSIVVPDSVNEIKGGAFAGCVNLESITLPFVGQSRKTETDTYQYPLGYIFGTEKIEGTIATVQYYYGKNTTSTTNTTYYIPSKLKTVTVTGGEILYGAFYNCATLESVTLKNMQAIGNSAFYNCENLKLVDLPAGVTSIGTYAFDSCGSLQSVTFPAGLTTIGKYAFLGCSSLKSVTLPEGITDIYAGTFSGCSGLATIILPASLTSVSDSAFRNCSSLWHIAFAGTEEQWNAVTVAGGYNTSFTKATWHCGVDGSNVKDFTKQTCTTKAMYRCDLCAQVFYDNSYPGTHDFVDGVCTVCGASELFTYTVANDQITITKYTGTAAEVVIPSTIENITVTAIGANAFKNNTTLKKVSIPDAVTSIGTYAFSGCTLLASVALPAGLTSVDADAFYNCPTLWHVFYGGSEEQWSAISIGNYNTALTAANHHYGTAENLTVLDKTTCTISPLYQCKVCNSVCYDRTYTGTHTYADGKCSVCGVPEGFTYTIADEKITITKYTGTVTDLEIPATIEGYPVVTIGKNAFYNNKDLTRVQIPEGVTTIEDYAFANCSKLQVAYLPASLTSISYYSFEYSAVSHVLYGGTSEQWGPLPTPSYFQYVDVHTDADKDTVQAIDNTTCTKKAIYKCNDCGDVLFDSAYTGSHNFVDGVCTVCGLDQYLIYTIGADGVTITDYVGTAAAVTVPDTIEGYPVIAIAEDAFAYCSSIQSISIGKNVKKIGAWAFHQTENIKEVHISDMTAWMNCVFSSTYGNPLLAGSGSKKLYLNGELVTKVVVPEGQKAIAYGAFANCPDITEVTLTENMESIESYAFYNSGITQLVIPEGMQSIHSYAFNGCKSLTSVTLPVSLKSIGAYAFNGCSKLTKIYLTDLEAWLNVKFADYGSTPMIANDLSKSLYLNGKLVLDLVIPEGITSIPDYAFRYCTDLQSVTIPDSVTSIGHYAFYHCENVTTLSLGNGVQTIGEAAFSYNKKLEAVTLPQTLTTIGESGFNNCDALTEVVIPNSVTSVGRYAFSGSDKLERAVLGTGMTVIPESMFSNCSKLNAVTIPNSVKTISNNAFSSCTALTAIQLPDSVETIGSNAFYYCAALTEIVLPESVTSIGASAFNNCNKLESIRIPGKVTDVGEYAFRYCSKLTSVVFADGVQNIDRYAFADCKSLVYVVIPASMSTISNNAFANCGQLWHVLYTGDEVQWNGITISSENDNLLYATRHCDAKGDEVSVTAEATCLTSIQLQCSICNAAYSNPDYQENHNYVNGTCIDCGLLQHMGYQRDGDTITITGYWGSAEQIVIPAEIAGIPVTAISNYAFDGSNITSVTIPNNVTFIGDNAFDNCKKLTTVNFGTGSDKDASTSQLTTIGRYAFNGCSALTQIVLPNSVTKISEYAFANCTELASITFGNKITSAGKNLLTGCEKLWHVLFRGTSAQWKKLKITASGTIHYSASGDEVTVRNETTCLEKIICECSICNQVNSETIPGGNHDFVGVEWVTVLEPTCTEKGKMEKKCNNCSHTETNEIDMLGHTGGTATCKALAVCERCEEAYGQLNADNHIGETEIRNDKAATCTVDGYTGDTHCVGCDVKLASGEAIPATGHTPSQEWSKDTRNHWKTCTSGCGVIASTKAAHEAANGGETCDTCGFPMAEVETGLLGDANGDDRVLANDAMLVLQYSVGAIKADKLNVDLCDVNGDGKILANDAMLILQYSVGAIKKFPAEK